VNYVRGLDVETFNMLMLGHKKLWSEERLIDARVSMLPHQKKEHQKSFFSQLDTYKQTKTLDATKPHEIAGVIPGVGVVPNG